MKCDALSQEEQVFWARVWLKPSFIKVMMSDFKDFKEGQGQEYAVGASAREA